MKARRYGAILLSAVMVTMSIASVSVLAEDNPYANPYAEPAAESADADNPYANPYAEPAGDSADSDNP